MSNRRGSSRLGVRRQGQRRLAAAVALLGAALLLSVGAGVGVPHLVRSGWSVTTAAGIIGLALGLALAVAAGVMLARSVPWPWRLPLVIGSAVATLLVVYLLAIPLAATVVPPSRADGRTPADVGLRFREVRLPTADGDVLAAWYVPSSNSAAVVLLHGSGSSRSAVVEHAAVLARHGYGVLIPDARGHGDSGGRAMDFGWHGDKDVRAATAWLARPGSGIGAGSIGAVGLSMGGEEAIGALGADPRLSAVVAEGATGRVAADLDWLSERYGWRGAAQEGLERVQTAVAAVLSGLDPPAPLRDALQDSRVPVLLVAAGQRPDEGYAAADLRHAASGPVAVWVVPGSDHGGGLAVRPTDWESRVVGLLDRALLPSGE